MKNAHILPSYFSNPLHPISITIVGCGGTGSLLLARLARMDSALNAMGMPGIVVTAHDGDIVEQQNVGRQNFFQNDLGQNKAQNLISKINNTFGVQWKAIPYMLAVAPSPSNILITCVDNVNTRKIISNCYNNNTYSERNTTLYLREENKPYYWIDTGNGKDFGQVVLSTYGNLEQPKIEGYNTVGRLEDVFQLFGEMENMESEETQGMGSCSMAESLNKQDLFVNDSIAVSAVNLLWKILRQQSLVSQGVILNTTTQEQMPLKIRTS